MLLWATKHSVFCLNSEAILGLKLSNLYWLSFLYTFVLDPNDHF
jgi:hypothetical protein